MDPLSLSVLGAAATQTIIFLYSQAGELLKARRERRAGSKTVDVPIVDNAVLDRPLPSAEADAELLEREHKTLVNLSASLSPVASGHVDLDLTDPEIARRAGQLRALLEAIYGQRITFRGEDRESSGSRVDVVQVVRDVEGSLTGAAGDIGEGGYLTVEQRTGTIGSSGQVTGYRGRIGHA